MLGEIRLIDPRVHMASSATVTKPVLTSMVASAMAATAKVLQPTMIGQWGGTASASRPEACIIMTSNSPAGTRTRPALVAVYPWIV